MEPLLIINNTLEALQSNILWTSTEYHSLENCLVKSQIKGSEVLSTIIGYHNDKIYKIEYYIKTNKNWETLFLEIKTRHGNQNWSVTLESDGMGNWRQFNKVNDKYKGCIDIDISLTPFTNTLPIKRLKLKKNESVDINVVYCDIINEVIERRCQKYICESEREYQFQNVPNDFEATIDFDDGGFVKNYPSLFVQTAKTEYSNRTITKFIYL